MTQKTNVKSNIIKILDLGLSEPSEEQHLAIVEDAFQTYGQSEKVKAVLAQALNLSPHKLRMFQRRLLRKYEKEIDLSSKEKRASLLLEIDGFTRQAAEGGSWTSVAQMISLKSKLLGLEETEQTHDLKIQVVQPKLEG